MVITVLFFNSFMSSFDKAANTITFICRTSISQVCVRASDDTMKLMNIRFSWQGWSRLYSHQNRPFSHPSRDNTITLNDDGTINSQVTCKCSSHRAPVLEPYRIFIFYKGWTKTVALSGRSSHPYGGSWRTPNNSRQGRIHPWSWFSVCHIFSLPPGF